MANVLFVAHTCVWPRPWQNRTMRHRPHTGKVSQLGNDVCEVEFTIVVAGETVPCVVWKPGMSVKSKALVAFGHGGSQHKKARAIRDRAIRYAMTFGWTSLSIDAPMHGDRISREEAEAARLKTESRMRGDLRAPSLSSAEKIVFLDKLATQAVPEWQDALDSTIASFAPDVDSFGYCGISQGTWIGVPLLAAEKRFACAVFGLAQLHPDHVEFKHAAQRIQVPLRFAFQWDDMIRSREYGIALFNAFGSSEKSMHINPGGHAEIPVTEVESWDSFFQSHI